MPHPDTAAASVTEHFATLAQQVSWESLPVAVRAALSLRLIDHLGLIALGSRTAAGAAVVAAVSLESGDHPLLFGERAVNGSGAALAHGTLSHVLDFDDTFPDSVVHPSSVLLPAVLAAARPDTTLAEALAAAASGYELLARVGRDAGRDFHARGFHATAVLGPVAAALASGRVMAASTSQLVDATGLAGSMSSGLLEFLSDGTWSKRMHPGWAAQGGLRSAQLALAGFRGPARIVEGRYGIFQSFLGRGLDDPAAVVDGLGAHWHSQTATAKLLPCAHVIHPFVRLLRQLRTDTAFDAQDVREVRCTVAPWYAPIVCEPREEKVAPSSEYQARASLPYVLAVELLGHGLGLDSFEEPIRGHPTVLDACRRIVHISDESLTKGFDGALTVLLHDGRQYTASASDLPEPEHPSVTVLEKFRDNLEAAGHGHVAEELAQAVMDPESIRVADLARITRSRPAA